MPASIAESDAKSFNSFNSSLSGRSFFGKLAKYELKRRFYEKLDDFKNKVLLYKEAGFIVYRARCAYSGGVVVIKGYARETLTLQTRQRIWNEVNLLQTAQCPFIIKCFDSFEDQGWWWLVLENCAAGDLYHIVQTYGPIREEGWLVSQVLLPLLQTVAYLHNEGIMHRDIKPEHVLFNSEKVAKLSGFYLAWDVNRFGFPKDMVGTLDYVAPEVFLLNSPERKGQGGGAANKATYEYKIDIWMVGIMTYDVLVGKPPFNVDDPNQTVENILLNDPEWPEFLSDDAVDFMQQALQKKPEDRPTARQLLSHPWVRMHMDWAPSADFDDPIPDVDFSYYRAYNAEELDDLSDEAGDVVVKKVWYNPLTWFSRRTDLDDLVQQEQHGPPGRNRWTQMGQSLSGFFHKKEQEGAAGPGPGSALGGASSPRGAAAPPPHGGVRVPGNKVVPYASPPGSDREDDDDDGGGGQKRQGGDGDDDDDDDEVDARATSLSKKIQEAAMNGAARRSGSYTGKGSRPHSPAAASFTKGGGSPVPQLALAGLRKAGGKAKGEGDEEDGGPRDHSTGVIDLSARESERNFQQRVQEEILTRATTPIPDPRAMPPRSDNASPPPGTSGSLAPSPVPGAVEDDPMAVFMPSVPGQPLIMQGSTAAPGSSHMASPSPSQARSSPTAAAAAAVVARLSGQGISSSRLASPTPSGLARLSPSPSGQGSYPGSGANVMTSSSPVPLPPPVFAMTAPEIASRSGTPQPRRYTPSPAPGDAPPPPSSGAFIVNVHEAPPESQPQAQGATPIMEMTPRDGGDADHSKDGPSTSRSQRKETPAYDGVVHPKAWS